MPYQIDIKNNQFLKENNASTKHQSHQDNEKYKDLFYNAPVVYIVLGSGGSVKYANKAAQLWLGYSRDEFIGMNILDLYADESKPRSKELLNQLLQCGVIENEELVYLRKNGQKAYGLLSATPLLDKRGQLVEICKVVSDINEMKQAEIRYNTIIKTTIDGFWVSDLNGKLLEVNDSYCNMVGYTREEMLTMSIADLDTDETPDDVVRRIKDIIKEGYAHFETKHKCKNGKVIDIENSVNYLDINGGQIFVFLRNITNRKQTEREIQKYKDKLEKMVKKRTNELESKNRQLQEQISLRIELTRALVHELKTPLTPLLSASEYLVSQLPEGLLQSFAKNIQNGAVNIESRINNLMDLAKGELGLLDLNYKKTDLKQLIKETVEYFMPEFVKKKQKILVRRINNIPLVWIDREKIQQVILNLLDNASKYTRKGGKIILSTSILNDTIIVEVNDNGIGIDKDSQKHLFQPYSRLKSGKRNLGGLGLGLAISKLLIELHNGDIWAIT